LTGSQVSTLLGLGTAAFVASSTFLAVATNLSDLASASTARTNLGLGTAATQATSAFDAAGSASTAVSNLLASSNTWTNANAFNTTLSSVGACTFDTGATGSTFGGTLVIGGAIQVATITGAASVFWGQITANGGLKSQSFVQSIGGCVLDTSAAGSSFGGALTIGTGLTVTSGGIIVSPTGGATSVFWGIVQINSALQVSNQINCSTIYIASGNSIVMQGGSDPLIASSASWTDNAGSVTMPPITNAPTGCTKWVWLAFNNNGVTVYGAFASP